MHALKRFVPCFLLLALACHAQNDGTAAAHGPIVVLITIDGFPARALNDPRLPMPALRKLEAAGSHAEAMQPINPAITWPNHTTLITGVPASSHHVLANGLIRFPADGHKPTLDRFYPREEFVHGFTLYDALAQKGMSTGEVGWPAIYQAHNVRWNFTERPHPGEPIADELIRAGSATREEIADFQNGSSPAWRDQIWTDAAIDILTHHTPNLLLFHLLETDTIQHATAPFSPAAYASYAYADACIQRLIDAAHAAKLLDRITFVVTSDHGFTTYNHVVHVNAVLAQDGLLQKEGSSYRGPVWVVAEGGTAGVFIRDPVRRAELTARLRNEFAGTEGVAAVYSNAEAQALGFPALNATDQAADLYLAAKPGYSLNSEGYGPLITEAPITKGDHGYLNSNPDMSAILILSGRGIRSGVSLGTVSNLSVAPTLARLLGVTLPDAKQPALKEALP